MPRLIHYRERSYLNLYDAVKLNELEDYTRLFGNRNIGNRVLTNMVVAGQLWSDMTFAIGNIYVRTNLSQPRPRLTDEGLAKLKALFVDGHDADAIGTVLRAMAWERSPLARALEEWAHVTRLEVIFGDKPVFEMNAHDLMDGPALGPDLRPPLAMSRDGKEGHIVETYPRGTEPQLQVPWRKCIARPLLLPVRQNVSVVLNAPDRMTHILRREATNAGILPEPLVWVHLEGLGTRDIYPHQ